MSITALTFDEKYQAIIDRNPAFEGQFLVAVKTTKIFCRPVCSARKPKKENVEFYQSSDEALQHGYRPCKVCKPLEPAGATPSAYNSLITRIKQQPSIKVKDKQLKDIGLEPSRVRRWFKKNYGMTFHAYQRKLRLNKAHHNIKLGKSVTQTAYDHGYESLSGFNEGFLKTFGVPPTRSKTRTVIQLSRFTTPIGVMLACATAQGLCLLEFSDRKSIESSFKSLCRLMNGIILPGTNEHLDLLKIQLQQYFDHKRAKFDIPLHNPGTSFQRRTWQQLTKIPYGHTTTYRQLAAAIGSPKAVRAVAAANGQNRLAIIIPCHRVIGSDGNLRGYAGGLSRKKWLLDHEQVATITR